MSKALLKESPFCAKGIELHWAQYLQQGLDPLFESYLEIRLADLYVRSFAVGNSFVHQALMKIEGNEPNAIV